MKAFLIGVIVGGVIGLMIPRVIDQVNSMIEPDPVYVDISDMFPDSRVYYDSTIVLNIKCSICGETFQKKIR